MPITQVPQLVVHPSPQAEVNTVTQCANDVGVRGLGAGFPPKHSFPEGNTASTRQAAHAEAARGQPVLGSSSQEAAMWWGVVLGAQQGPTLGL